VIVASFARAVRAASAAVPSPTTVTVTTAIPPAVSTTTSVPATVATATATAVPTVGSTRRRRRAIAQGSYDYCAGTEPIDVTGGKAPNGQLVDFDLEVLDGLGDRSVAVGLDEFLPFVHCVVHSLFLLA
jgi:hypothetical protein